MLLRSLWGDVEVFREARGEDDATTRQVRVTDDPIPESLLRSHPELAKIADALDAHRRGDPVRGTCPNCGAAIQVTDIDAVHVTVVACANGHMLYRAKRSADRGPILV